MPGPSIALATGFASFDLVAPQKFLGTLEARCRVCGKPDPGVPLFASLRVGRPARDGHESCRAQVSDWKRQVALLAEDPQYVAASAAAAEACRAAIEVWHEQLEALEGVPDWFKGGQFSPLEQPLDE